MRDERNEENSISKLFEAARRSSSERFSFLSVLSSETRVGILRELRKGSRNVSQLAEALAVHQTQVSQSLKVLAEAGFIKKKVEGRFRIYALANLDLLDFLDAIEHMTPRSARGGGETARVSQTGLRAIIENAPISMAVTDAEGRYTFVGGSALKRFGFTEDQFLGKSVFELYKDDRAVVDNMRKAYAGVQVVWTNPLKDRLFQMTSIPSIGPNGKVESVMTIVLDITEKEEHQQWLHAILEAAPMSVSVTDRAGKYEFLAGEYVKRSGKDAAFFMGKSIFDMYADEPNIIDNMRRAYAGEKIKWCLERHGRTLEVTCMPIAGPDGKTARVVSVTHDVTERPDEGDQARGALAERRAELLLERLPTPAMLFAADGRATACNGAWRARTGWLVEQTVGDGWLAAVHPEDRNHVARRLRTVFDDGAKGNAVFRFFDAAEQVIEFQPVDPGEGAPTQWLAFITPTGR